MARFVRRPRNMSRMFQGRMFNRRTGGYAPSLYSGFRPRRAMHRRFQTQTSPYGAAGGGTRQYHAGHSGHAGNVYAAMMHHARRQGGVNMGLLPSTTGYRGTRMHRGFRQDQASIKRDFQNRIRDERKKLRNAKGVERNRIRAQIATLRGEHRSERRAHAQGIQTKWARTHGFNLGGGKNRQWRPNQTASGERLSRRHMLSPRIGINVGQNPYTGRRSIQGLNFRRHQGGGLAGFNRAQARNMRIAKRMSGGKGLDMRLHGQLGKKGGLVSGRGVMRTHADFTRGGNRRGWIGVGNHWNTGLNAGRVIRPHTFPLDHDIYPGTFFQPYWRSEQRGRRGESRYDSVPQTNRAMTPWEQWHAGGRRGPQPLQTQPDWNRFNPFYHSWNPSNPDHVFPGSTD